MFGDYDPPEKTYRSLPTENYMFYRVIGLHSILNATPSELTGF